MRVRGLESMSLFHDVHDLGKAFSFALVESEDCIPVSFPLLRHGALDQDNDVLSCVDMGAQH